MKGQLLFITTIFFVSLSLWGQSIKDNAKIIQKNYFEEVDFEILYGKIIVPVTIDDKTYRFILDTGAPNLISEKVAKEVNLTNVQVISVKDANNSVENLSLGTVGSIKVGNIHSEQNTVLISAINEHPLLKCYNIDGLLGSNFFKNSILKISLTQKKLWITDKVKKLNLSVSPSKLKLVGNQLAPFIKVNFLNNENLEGTEELMIDTGMDGFYEISNRSFADFKDADFFTILSTASGTGSVGLFGAGNENEQYLLQTDYFKINQTQFSNLITNTTEDQNSRIGIGVLEYGDMTLDFKNKKFYFEAADKITLQEPVPIYVITLLDNKLIIGFVWDAEYSDLLQYGDEILRIGTHKISETDLCNTLKLREYRTQNSSHELEIKTKDNQIKTVKIISKY